MPLDPPRNAAGDLWFKGLVERIDPVATQVVGHQDHFLSMPILHLDQPPEFLSNVDVRPTIRDAYAALSREWLHGQKDIGGAVPSVFVIFARDCVALTGSGYADRP